MVTERKLGTEDNPDIKDQTKSVSVPVDDINIEAPPRSFDDEMFDALQISISEDEIVFDEPTEQEAPQIPFDANLVEFLDDDILGSISSKLLYAIENDKESRKEWEKTYTDGLKYLGMRFDEQRSQPFEG